MSKKDFKHKVIDRNIQQCCSTIFINLSPFFWKIFKNILFLIEIFFQNFFPENIPGKFSCAARGIFQYSIKNRKNLIIFPTFLFCFCFWDSRIRRIIIWGHCELWPTEGTANYDKLRALRTMTNWGHCELWPTKNRVRYDLLRS